MTPRSLECLERCLPAIDDRTGAPLRVLGHATTTNYEVFEVAETAVVDGMDGARRFIVSVKGDLSQALLVPVSPLKDAA
jgi:hypothetical protein